jgi:hypothetical protein
MKTSLTFFMLVAGSIYSGHGQTKQYVETFNDYQWQEGSIVLIDGSTLPGLLKYNEKTGLLSFKTEDSFNTYNARSVSKFNFHDTRTNTERTFYSIIYNDPDLEIELPVFFEVLSQFKTFALLSKVDPIVVDEKYKPNRYANTAVNGSGIEGATTIVEVVSQDETLFFIDDQGDISPYVRITRRDDRRNEKITVLDVASLPKYTAPHYDRVFDYAKNEKLRLDKKEDLVLILNYYRSLIEGKR